MFAFNLCFPPKTSSISALNTSLFKKASLLCASLFLEVNEDSISLRSEVCFELFSCVELLTQENKLVIVINTAMEIVFIKYDFELRR